MLEPKHVNDAELSAQPPVKTKEQAYGVVRACYRRMIPWLMFVVVFSYMDRFNLSYAAPTFKRSLQLDNVKYGFGSGIVYIGYGLAMIPSTYMVRVVGAPYWLGIIAVAWGITCACMAAVTTPAGFYATRFFLGVAEAGTFPAMWVYLNFFFSQSEMSVATAIINGLGGVLLQLIGAPLATGFLFMEGIGGLHGWQWLFLMEGLITVLFGVAVAFGLPKTPAHARFLSGEERSWLAHRQEQAVLKAHKVLPMSSGAWACLRTWKMPYLMVCWFIISVVQIGILFFVPLMVQAMKDGTFGGGAAVKKNLTPRQQASEASVAALIAALLYLPGTLGGVYIAWSSKRFSERNLHTAIPLCIGGILLTVTPTVVKAGGPIAGFVFLAASAAGGWSVYGPVIAWPATFLQGDALLLGYPVFNTAAAVGGFVGPYLLGALNSKGGYTLVMRVFGVLNCVAGILLFFFRPGNLEHMVAEHEAAMAKEAHLPVIPPPKDDV